MPSTIELEETLPLMAPVSKAQFPRPKNDMKFTVYSTVPLDDGQRQQLLADLHDYEDTCEMCQLSPGQFQHKSLRDVYEYHIRARDKDPTIYPDYFIVVDHADWDIYGVLMVNLDVYTERKDEPSVISVARLDVRGLLGVECMCVNMDIANMNWEDVKYTAHEHWGGEDPKTNKRLWATNPDTALVPTYDSTVYTWYTLVRPVLRIENMLEPDSLYYNKGESRFALGSLYTKEPDPLTKFRRKYPWTCLTSERIHRKLLLVAEKEDANSEKGMAICIAKWDGDLSNFAYDPKTNKLVEGDMDQLMAIQPEIEFVEHVRAHHALERLDNLAEDLEDGISIQSSQFCYWGNPEPVKPKAEPGLFKLSNGADCVMPKDTPIGTVCSWRGREEVTVTEFLG